MQAKTRPQEGSSRKRRRPALGLALQALAGGPPPVCDDFRAPWPACGWVWAIMGFRSIKPRLEATPSTLRIACSP